MTVRIGGLTIAAIVNAHEAGELADARNGVQVPVPLRTGVLIGATIMASGDQDIASDEDRQASADDGAHTPVSRQIAGSARREAA